MKISVALFFPLLLIFSACKPEEVAESGVKAEELEQAAVLEDGRIDSRMYPVTPGDEWTYVVTLEVAAGAQTSELQGEPTETKDGITIYKHEQRRIYRGREELVKDIPPFDVFEMLRDGKVVEREFMKIGDRILETVGRHDLSVEGAKPQLFHETPIAVLRDDFYGGQQWSASLGQDARGEDRFLIIRVIGEEPIETPLRTFKEAIRVEVAVTGFREQIQSFWFVKGVGFVAETSQEYIGDTLVYEKTSLLREAKIAAAAR